MLRSIKLILLIIILLFLSTSLFFIYSFFNNSRHNHQLSPFLSSIILAFIAIVILIFLRKLMSMEIALAISSLIFILFLIACGLTPSNLEPVRKIYIIRTCDSSGYILSDDFCYYTCPLVTNLRLNGHVCIYDSDTESYIERKCYSYRLAQAIYNSNISDKCQFDIIYSSVGFERFLFPIRLICEQSYNYFVSSWILLLIVVLIDLFKKESAFPIDSIKMKDVLKIALPITILILFFNILYWIELSKINCI